MDVYGHWWIVIRATALPQVFADEADALQHVQECGGGIVVEVAPVNQPPGAVEIERAARAVLDAFAKPDQPVAEPLDYLAGLLAKRGQ